MSYVEAVTMWKDDQGELHESEAQAKHSNARRVLYEELMSKHAVTHSVATLICDNLTDWYVLYIGATQ